MIKRIPILVPFLSAVLLFSTLRPAAAFTAGDVDGDGAVTLKDAVLALRGIVDPTALNPAQRAQGDLDGDGVLDLYDVTLILETAIGVIPSLTVTSPDALIANVGDPSIQFTIRASGGTGVPQLSLTDTPPAALFTPATGVFFWGPVTGQAGDYSLHLTVTSGSVAAERTIVLHILPRGLSPTPPNRLVDGKIDFDPVAMPRIGTVGGIVVAPNGDIFVELIASATSPAEFYKSSDEGASWSLLPDPLQPNVSAFCLNANGELVAAYGLIILPRSNVTPGVQVLHKGVWTHAANISADREITSLTLAPNGKDLLAVTAWQGDVWRSTDDGSTFNKAISNLYHSIGDSDGALWTISSAGPKVYTGGEGDILESDDGGNTFKDIGPAHSNGNVYLIVTDQSGEPVTGDRRVAGSGSPLIKLSGGIWQGVNGLDSYITALDLISHHQFGDVMYASNFNGQTETGNLFISYDGGSNWQRVSTNLDSEITGTHYRAFHYFAITRSGRLMFATFSEPSTLFISRAAVP